MDVTRPPVLRRADVIALLLLLLVAVAAAPQALGRARELANRTSCSANLGGLLKSMIVYSADNNDIYPCTPGKSDTKYTLTFGPGEDKAQPKAAMDILDQRQGDPLASLWILTLNNVADPKWLICKSDPFATAGPSPLQDTKGMWMLSVEKPSQISYSLNFPWTTKGEAGKWWTSASFEGDQPVLADMAPLAEPKASPPRDPTMKDPVQVGVDDKGQPTTAPAGAPAKGPGFAYNSANHQFEGQNIGYDDAHTEWHATPLITRKDKSTDNIWTRATKDGEQAIAPGDIGGALPAKAPYDTVMVPARASDGSLK